MAFKFSDLEARTPEEIAAADARRRRDSSDRDLVAAVEKDLKRTRAAAPRLARGRMLLTPDTRKGSPGFNDLIARATPVAQPERLFDLILFGERADLFEDSVLQALYARREAAIDAASGTPSGDIFAAADAERVEIEVEGYWHTRWWKDRDGKWRNAKELLVARWTLVEGAEAPAEPIGWLPEALSPVEA